VSVEHGSITRRCISRLRRRTGVPPAADRGVKCHVNSSWPQRIAIWFGATTIAVGFLLAGIYPYRPASLLVLVVLFVIALPIYLSVEYTGTLLFGSKMAFEIPSRMLRLLYGVFVILIAVALGLYAFSWAKLYFVPWGT